MWIKCNVICCMFIFVGVKKHVIMFLCSKALGGFQNGGGKGDGYMRKKMIWQKDGNVGWRDFPSGDLMKSQCLLPKCTFNEMRTSSPFISTVLFGNEEIKKKKWSFVLMTLAKSHFISCFFIGHKVVRVLGDLFKWCFILPAPYPVCALKWMNVCVCLQVDEQQLKKQLEEITVIIKVREKMSTKFPVSK